MTLQIDRTRLRESFILFYLTFFAGKILYFLFPARPLALLVTLVGAAYVPAMLFAAGMDIKTMWVRGRSFRKKTLYRALIFFCIYFFVGFITEAFIRRRAVFSTVKDLVAILRMPPYANIFLLLSLIYLLAAWLAEPAEAAFKRFPWLPVALSILGMACLLIPEGLIGYSQIGLFIGGDTAGAIPLAPYLTVVFMGIWLCGKQVTDRKNLMLIGILLAAGILCLAAGKRSAGLVLAGTAAAPVWQILLSYIDPLYVKVEGFFLKLWIRVLILYKKIEAARARSKKIDIAWYYAGYTLLFVIISGFVFVPHVMEGRTLIWSVDGLGQYVPKIFRFTSYAPQAFMDFIRGREIAQYDFSSGLGAPLTVGFDPVYWLYAFVKPENIEMAYAANAILRYFLSGAAMSALILYLRKSHLAAYCASFAYCFGGFALYAGMKHAQFIAPLYLLPLLAMGMEMLIRDKKWKLLTVMAAFSLLTSYYFFYMNTIAIGIYFVLRILCDKKLRSFKTFFGRGLMIAGSYLVGVCIASISLIVQFGGYMGSGRTHGSSFSQFLSITPLFYRKEWIPDFFMGMISDEYAPGMWLKLGFAPLAVFALILLFTRKNRKELKLLYVIFTGFCFFPIMGYVFSGFSTVNNRWAYIYAAIVAVIFAVNFDHFKEITDLEYKLMVGLAAVYTTLLFFSTKYRTDKLYASYGLLMLTLVFILLVNSRRQTLFRKYPQAALMIITLFTVVIGANIYVTHNSDQPDGGHLGTYVKSGTALKILRSGALRNLDKVEGSDEGGFYRATNQVTAGNQRSSSLVLGYNDLSTFTSTINGNITYYNKMMGNCDWNVVSIYSYNNRTIMNELAAVRYLGTSSKRKAAIPYGYREVLKKKKKKAVQKIYENQYALPLGYTYDSFMEEEDADSLSALQRQEASLMTAIVSDGDEENMEGLRQETEDSLDLSAHKVKILDEELKGVTREGDSLMVKPGSSIRYRFRGEADSETYLGFKGDIFAEKDSAEHFIKMRIKSKDTSYMYKFRIDAYTTWQDEFLFNLGYHKEPIYECVISFDKEGILKGEDMCVYSQPMNRYAGQTEALKKNALENVKTSKNTLTGQIRTDAKKLLVIALPYQTGWTAYVDGKEARISNVNYQYMGLLLDKGDHSIRLHYQLPHSRWIPWITAGGLLVFAGLIVLEQVMKKRKKEA